MTCRICFEDGELIQPCHCKGSTAYVHEHCLIKWLTVSNRTDCEICKFEYGHIEIEEHKKEFCPPWSFADSTLANAFVLFVGVFGHFVLMYFISIYDLVSKTEDLFVYANAFQAFFLLVLYPWIRTREVIVFWKCCSTACILSASIVENDWTFFMFESITTVILAMMTHTHLVNSYKEVVRYINIEDHSVNGETVQRS